MSSSGDYRFLAKYVAMVETAKRDYTPLALQLATEEARDFLRERAGELFGGDEEKFAAALARAGDDFSTRLKAVRTFYDNLTSGRGIYAWVNTLPPESLSGDTGNLHVNFIEGPLQHRIMIGLEEGERAGLYPLEEEYIFVAGIVVPIMADSKNSAAEQLAQIAESERVQPAEAVRNREYRERAIQASLSGHRKQDVEWATGVLTTGFEKLDNDLMPEINRLSLGYLRAHMDQVIPPHTYPGLEIELGRPTPDVRDEAHAGVVTAASQAAREQAAQL